MSNRHQIQQILEEHAEAIILIADTGDDGQVKLTAFAKMDEENSILASYLSEMTQKVLSGQANHRETVSHP